jgi:hypothetical protein
MFNFALHGEPSKMHMNSTGPPTSGWSKGVTLVQRDKTTYTQVGVELSMYCGKTRSYLLHKHIPFVERWTNAWEFFYRFRRRNNAAAIPVVITPEGAGLDRGAHTYVGTNLCPSGICWPLQPYCGYYCVDSSSRQQ